MAVSITYEEETSNIDDYLNYAQIIAQAFTKALDQQECNVKILIGLAEEIASNKDKVEDLYTIITNPEGVIDDSVVEGDVEGEEVANTVSGLTSDTDEIDLNTISKKIKEACIDCEFNFPTIDASSNFDWSFDALKAALEVYTGVFNKLLNPNYCHVASAFSFACIPSIISLIMLLVSAYAAILALQKLGGISLNAFIQGIISGLLGQIIASLSLRIDTSKTGVGCLIEAIREIAEDIVSQQDQISGLVPEQLLTELGYTPAATSNAVGLSSQEYLDTAIQEELDSLEDADSIQKLIEETANQSSISSTLTSASEWSREAFLETYATMTMDQRSIVDRYLDTVQDEMSTINNSISSAFKEVSNVLEDMVSHFNESLQQMFGLLDYFQCEIERSGSNFTAITEYINKIVTVINVLSAILTVVAKKQIQKLCKTDTSVATLVTLIEDTTNGEDNSLTELEQIEVVEEFLEKVVEITENENGDITPIIYDKDSAATLPKLSLTSCNLKDFIEAHSLENIIQTIVDEIRQEQAEASLDNNDDTTKPSGNNKSVALPSENVVDKNNWQVYPIQFEVPKYSQTRAENITSEILTNDFGSSNGVSSGIQSILELIYNNPLDSNNNSTESSDNYTPTDNNDDAIKNKEYRDFISSPLSVDKSQKKSFENKCKDISDVLESLGTLTKK